MFPIYDTRNVNEVISTSRYGIAAMVKKSLCMAQVITNIVV